MLWFQMVWFTVERVKEDVEILPQEQDLNLYNVIVTSCVCCMEIAVEISRHCVLGSLKMPKEW